MTPQSVPAFTGASPSLKPQASSNRGVIVTFPALSMKPHLSLTLTAARPSEK